MVLLGNLSVAEIEKRIGFDFPDDIKIFMEETRQQEASNIAKGKWHCFDMPFNIVCGDIDIATKIYESVKNRKSEVKEALQFSIEK